MNNKKETAKIIKTDEYNGIIYFKKAVMRTEAGYYGAHGITSDELKKAKEIYRKYLDAEITAVINKDDIHAAYGYIFTGLNISVNGAAPRAVRTELLAEVYFWDEIKKLDDAEFHIWTALKGLETEPSTLEDVLEIYPKELVYRLFDDVKDNVVKRLKDDGRLFYTAYEDLKTDGIRLDSDYYGKNYINVIPEFARGIIKDVQIDTYREPGRIYANGALTYRITFTDGHEYQIILEDGLTRRYWRRPGEAKLAAAQLATKYYYNDIKKLIKIK